MPFWVITRTVVSSAVWMPTFHNRAIFLGVLAIKCCSFETMLEAFLSSIYLVTMGSSGEERFKIVFEVRFAVAILMAGICAPQ
jgi:hypothetical protein